VLNGRLDAQLYSKLKEAADSYRAKCRTCPLSETRGEHPGPRFPAATILPLIEQHGLSLPERDRSAFLALTDSLKDITEQHAAGVAGRTVYALLTLVRQYLHVERAFACPGRVEDCLVGLRSSHSPAEMYDMCRSHEALAMKNQLLLTLLDDIGLASAQARAVAELDHGTAAFMVPVSGVPARHAGIAKDMSAFIPILTEIGSLADSSYSTVAARARSLLIEQSTPSIAQRKRRMGLAISSARSCPMEEKTQVIQSFVEEHVPVREILLDFLKDDNSRHIAAEIYIRQIYSTYSIQEYSNGMDNGLPWGAFIFSSKGGIRLSSTALGSASSTDLIHISSSMGGTSSDQLDKKWSAPPASPNLSDVESETVTEKIPASVPRYGAFGVADTFEDLDVVLPKLLEHIPQFTGSRPRSALGPINVLHIAVITGPIYKTDDAHDRGDECAEVLAPILYRHATSLNQAGVGRLTIVVGGGPGDSKSFPSICTFRSRADFAKEDLLLRHVEPSYAYNLDLARLSNFSLRLVHTSQGTGGNVHLYAGKPLHQAARAAGLSAASLNMRRYFARVVSETREFMGGEGNRYFVEKMFVEALNQLDLAIARKSAQLDPRPPPPTNNHIFINCVTPTEPDVRPTEVAAHMRQLMQRFADKISRLGITHFEMKIICRLSENTPEAPMRLVASNPTGYVVRVDSYQEVMEAGFTVFKGLSSSAGEWQGKNVHSPYPVTRPFEGRRLQALQRSDTLYCYDFVELIEHAAIQAWKDFAADRPHARITVPSSVVVSRELVVSRSGDCENGGAKNWHANELERLTLKPVDRPAGQNDVGMVAWLMTIRTPEYPAGRQLVLVANDITFQAGSFGTREDAVFLLATRFAQELGIPRLYFAANSGARIGMADSIKKKFKVSWVNPDDPTLGYEYLYLDSKDHEDLSAKGAVRCMRVPGEEDRWKIVDIIGEEGDLGVENLRGSGMIAGATATAYADIFTLTLVVGRCVGIGAYLVRLGQRAIQNASDSPIILTGYQALNTLMGGEVYSSNDQLGGIGVMLPNGVSHLTASNHLESVKAALKWLSYVPSSKCAYLPVVDITGVDMVERVIDFVPKRGQPYDPRHLIAGFHSELDARWVSGMFDKGSFTETLANWGKTVVTGRARLGGIPVGVIATDTRTQEKKVPADPADLSSQEKTCMQAGGVWFPDSAAKTAQAIQDLSHEGLPLMILANWRGFSGGQRDMFDEILKHGARIVDALVAYKQPVFVYIPPFAELRGGAWVVVDSTINSSVMEMYAASEGARGGVLEANGAASIKFRSHDLLAAAHRLDPELQQLDARVNEDASPFLEPNLRMDPQERSSVKSAIEARERKLMGVYRQLATQFADLHDTPGRMAAVGAIRKAVPWEGARSFFYWRLRRRLAEFDLRRQIAMAQQDVSLPTEASRVIQTWFEATTTEAGAAPGDWEDDKAVLAWMANSASVIHQRVSDIKYESVSEKVRELVNDSPDAVLKGLVSALDQLDPGIRRMLISKLQVD
jgi:acetyl-CoA carboxylase/biotin carboxylase 1